ncbi:P-loop containing nucleoside triphosphate hydrolase protein, partial [Paraphysoderma sedebokerense]
MANRKRPAHSQHSLSQDHEYNNNHTDNDGDTALLEQLSQEQEAPRRKRARKTQQLEQDTDALQEDADDPDRPSHHRRPQRQDQEGSDHEYHQGDQQEEEEDDDDEDEDDLLAAMTQQVEREDRKRKNDADRVAEKGVLEEVDLVNVMCHKRLSIKLNSRINFVIGHNGSGKSAILTAITICLGGKARETNRATNLRSLINDKSDTASVSVKIKNRGEDAYKPETYGPSIIVERKFTRAGSSTYYIRDHTGHTVTNRREELDNILDHMNIQIDNPMSVLTQDQARMFLNSSTPEDKYKAFDRGTNLAQLSESYTQVLDMTNAISRMVAQRRQILPDLRQKKNRALEKAKALERAADLEDTVDQLTHEMSWAHVTELEKKRAEAQAQADEELAKVQEADQKVAKNQAQLAEVEENIAEQQTKVRLLRTQLQPLVDEKKALQLEFRGTVKTIADIDQNIKDLNDDLATQKKNRDDIEERIETERQKMNTRTADEFERKRR